MMLRLSGWLSIIALALLPVQRADAAAVRDLAAVQFVTNVPFAMQLAAAKKIGIRNVRLGIRWYEVERRRGRLDWGPVDAKLNAILRGGMTPIVTLIGGNREYGPPAPPGGFPSPADSPEATEGFSRFAAAAARRYGAAGAGRPILYEIWNEPNTKTFWGRPPDPEGYARLAESACRAIKAAAPGAKVVGLAMEGSPVKSPYVVPAYRLDIYQEWANRAAAPGLMQCLDGISLHPYRPIPETYLSDEPKLQRFIGRHWTKPAPPMIANTEWGYQINRKRGHTADDQAAFDLRALLVGAGMGRLTNLYQIVDGGCDPDRPDQTYGLFACDGAIKPAGTAVQRLLQRIGDFEVDGVGPVAGTLGAFRFRAHRGALQADVWWNVGRPAPVVLAGGRGGGPAEAIDLVSGAPRRIQQDGTALVDGAPLLVLHGRT